MRLVFLPVLTGGLAYRLCYVMEAPPQSPRPRQSPALPIASAGPAQMPNLKHIFMINNEPADIVRIVFN